MAGKKIQVYKKIFWEVDETTNRKIKSYKFNQNLDSTSFEILIGSNITEWCLSFYPWDNNEKNKDSAGMYLVLKAAESRHFKAKYTLGIVGDSGNKEVEFEDFGESFDESRGTDNLLRRGELFNPERGHLIDGKMTLYCELTLTAKKITESEKKSALNQNLQSDFKKMMSDEIFADFKVETSDKKVLKVHKNVLAFRSPVFYGMLTTDMEETQINVLKVPEDAVIMKEVLRYIYSSEVENLNAIACELVFAAEKYQLDDLKQMCIASIIKTLTPGNVLQTLMAADRLSKSKELKMHCIELIASNYRFVSHFKDWKKLPSSLSLEITRRVSEDKGTIYV